MFTSAFTSVKFAKGNGFICFYCCYYSCRIYCTSQYLFFPKVSIISWGFSIFICENFRNNRFLKISWKVEELYLFTSFRGCYGVHLILHSTVRKDRSICSTKETISNTMSVKWQMFTVKSWGISNHFCFLVPLNFPKS